MNLSVSGLIIGRSVAGFADVVLGDLLAAVLDDQVVITRVQVGLNDDLSSVGVDCVKDDVGVLRGLNHHVEGRFGFLCIGGECKAFFFDSEDLLAVSLPIANLHGGELIDVEHPVTVLVVRFNRHLDRLSGNIFTVLVVQVIELILVEISIVRKVSHIEVVLNSRSGWHVILDALADLLVLLGDRRDDRLYEHPVLAQLAAKLAHVLGVGDVFVVGLQSVRILVKMVDLELES